MTLSCSSLQLTQACIDVAEDASRLHSDGVDVGHGLHVDALLPQDSLDALGLRQDAHCGGRRAGSELTLRGTRVSQRCPWPLWTRTGFHTVHKQLSGVSLGTAALPCSP